VNDSVGYAYGITAGDLNGDGRGDVVIANWSGGPVELRFNRGDSNGDGQIDYFVQMIEDAYDESGIGVDLGDVDGDGDLDFVLSRWDLQNEVVYLNGGDADGDGQLAFTTIELPTGGYTLESEFADIDADGDLDVISSDYDGAVRVSYNRGDRNGDARPDFDVQVVGGGAYGSYGVAVGDIDGDGDLDIVTPSWGGESRYLANQGDANGDGKLEFASTSLTGVIPSWDAEILAGGTAGGGAIREDGPAVTGNFAGNDVDGDALSYQILSAPQEGSVVNNGDGTFSFDPGDAFQELRAGETRDVSFQYRAVDPQGAVSNTGTVTVTVNGVNDVPVAVADTATTDEDTAVTLAVLANDSDVEGESLSVSQVNGQAIGVGGSVALAEGANVRLNADGTLTYTPGANVHGTRSFAYTVTDASGGSTTANASVAIASVNDAPVAADDVNIKASLVANSGFEATPNFAGWTVNTGASSTNFLGYSGSATIQRDATTGNAVAVLSLNGTVNQPGGSGYGPTIRSDAFNGSVGDTVSFDWQLSSGSDWALGNGFVKNAATGAIVATVFNFNTGFSGSTGWRHTDVSLNASGNFYMEFQVGSYDSTFGQAVGATMQLDFAGVLPQIHEDKILTLKPQDLLANDQDPDGDALTILDVADYSVLGSRLTVNADGTISYDPTGALNALDLGQTVTDSFLYTVSDGHGGTDTAAVSFSVQGRGDAVPAEDDFLFGTAGADNLNGAAGADVLAGLGGNDVLTGGAGNDTFLISAGSGRDTVTDFQSTDVVKLIGLGWSGFNDVTAHAVQDGANVVIDLEAGNTLTLVGVNLSALQADDFMVL
jgi:VCBS repeat-containing protein